MGSGRVVKLRDGSRGPVYGVRVEVLCPCGKRYPQMLTIGIDRPAAWCPFCLRRSHLHIRWDLSSTPREGQLVRWQGE